MLEGREHGHRLPQLGSLPILVPLADLHPRTRPTDEKQEHEPGAGREEQPLLRQRPAYHINSSARRSRNFSARVAYSTWVGRASHTSAANPRKRKPDNRNASFSAKRVAR